MDGLDIEGYISSTKICPKAVHCKDGNKYRTINGKCNNLEHLNWGLSNTPYIRVMPPNYVLYRYI